MIREDILQKFRDLFKTKRINGREVNVEQTIAALTRELGMRRDKSNRDDWTTLPISLLSSGLASAIGKRPWSSSNPRS
jgi:hypothetical protein